MQKVLIVTSTFNSLVTGSLKSAAQETLERAGDKSGGFQVDHVEVPGAFELPLAASTAAKTKNWQAIICLGCVIRGETPHFDYVCAQAASGILKTSLDYDLPVVFGVLTTDTIEQALSRAGLKGGNKGVEAAQAALEMLDTLGKIRRIASE